MRIRQTRISALARAVAIAALLWSSVPALAEVDQYGSYSTGIKIDVPVFHGLEPQVSLAYSSSGGNGNVGTGWGLHAASTIERASPGRGAPRYDTSDIFLLDGAELIPCAAGSLSPSCMTAGGVSIVGTHSTKIESYQKIRYESSNNTWMIWAKDGTRSLYSPFEQGSESPTPTGFANTFRWRLESVYDTHLNQVRYHYSCSLAAGSECYLDKITYGDMPLACDPPPPSPADTPSFKPNKPIPGVEIKFFWESRSDKIYYGNGRRLSEAILRLKSIRIKNAGWTNGAYVLNHVNSASSSRSLLAQVQQFGSDVVLCENPAGCFGVAYGAALTSPAATSLPPQQFAAPAMSGSSNSWSEAQALSGTPALSTSYSNVGFSGLTNPDKGRCATPCQIGSCVVGLRCLTGDVNNDRRLDEVCGYTTDTGTIRTAVSLSTKAGLVQVSNTESDFGDILTDMNGDGRDDMFTGPTACSRGQVLNGFCPKPYISVRLLTGDSSFEAGGGDIGELPSTWPFPHLNGARQSPFNYFVPVVGIFLAIDAKFAVPTPNAPDIAQQWFTGDVNADGMADFIYLYRDTINDRGNICTALSTGTGSFNFLPCQKSVWNWYDNETRHSRFFPADVNGDGKVDVVHIIWNPGVGKPAPLNHEHWTITTALSKGDGTYGFVDADQHAVWEDDSVWLPGDINGDGRTDLIQKRKHSADSVRSVDHAAVRIAISTGAGKFNYISKDVGFDWTESTSTTAQAPFYAADMTGDGRADLVGFWTEGAFLTTPRHVAMAPAGIHDSISGTQFYFQDLVTHTGQTAWGGNSVGDVNGDGRADVITNNVVNTTNPPSASCANDVMRFSYTAYFSNSGNDDYQNMSPIEQNGDGREDLVHIHFKNPGYKITTFLRTPLTATFSNTINPAYDRVGATFSPGDITGVTTPLDNPDTRPWMAGDLGGGVGNAADGKVDLVYVDHSGSTLHIYSLLSLGGGAWTKKYQSFPITTQFMAKHMAQSWLSSDVNGDGRSDLVHVSRKVREVQVDTLLSNGDGTWNWTPSSSYFADFYPDDVLFLSWFAGKRLFWMATDVNGDGKGDLVYVKNELDPFNVNANKTVVYSLISNFAPGNTSYTPVLSPYDYRFADTHNWRTADVNSDGLDDLVYISKPVDTLGVTLSYLLSLGNGTYSARTPLGPFTPSAALKSTYDDTQNFKFGDVNDDGKVDLVHVSAYANIGTAETGVFTLLNHYPTVTALSQLAISPNYKYRDARSWIPMDTDFDGDTDLTYVSPDINMLRVNSSDDRMSSHENGLLGGTTIQYRTSAGLHVNLPPGSLLSIADHVDQTDAVNGGSYRTNYSYTDAKWSYGERRFLGFAGTDTSEGHSILSRIYDQSDECGSRPRSVISKDSSGKVLRQNNSIYSSLPQGALPPYNCTLAIEYDNECEGVSPCLENKTEFVRDSYGNVVETDSWGRPGKGDDRRLLTPSNFNRSAYIVGLPAYMDLYDGTGTLQASRRYVYHQPTTSDWTLPPGPKAEITKTLDWNSDTGLYLATAYEHDVHGNQTLVTDPIGSYIKTGYDCNYNRYPVSICNNLFCTTATWNLGRGLMSSAVDANNQTTFYDYDALSRKWGTRSPDGSFTAKYFLDYGSNIQRDRTHVSDNSTGRWAGFRWTEDYFDGLRRTYKTTSEGATPIDADILFKQYTFVDASDRIFRESSVFKSAETPVWTTYSYDGLKRHIDTLLPGGVFHTYSTFLQGSEQKFNERGHMREFFHDAAGNIVKVRERHQTFENNAEGGSGAYDYYDTHYEYDANHRMTKITDSLGRTSTTDYNSLGWKRESRDWDLGISSYKYNPNGSLASEIDARNFSKEYTYDSIGRNTFTKHKDNTGSITRTITQSYDRDPATSLTQGSSLGRLVKISDITLNYKGCHKGPSTYYTRISAATTNTIESCVAGALAGGYDFAALESGGYCYGGFALLAPVAESECNTPCTGNSAEVCGGAGRGSVYGTWGSNTIVDASWYDNMGRPDQQQRCIDRGSGAARSCSSMMSTFDFGGRLKTLTYPDGEMLTSNYNGAGQLSSMSDYLTSALYNSQGQPTEETYANSTTTARTYDPNRFWPESMAVRPLSYKASYASYDGAGRLLTRTQIGPTEDTTYNYDDLNRLMTVASVSTPLLNQTFDYDRVGNITYNSKVGYYSYLPAHIHAVSSIFDPVLGGTYIHGYDANGNMRNSSNTNQLTWDNDNRITQDYNTVTGQTTNYTYDMIGRRVSKTVGANTTNYFSKYVETDASGTTKYYYAGDKLVAKRDPGFFATSLTFSWAVAEWCGGHGGAPMAFTVNNSLALSTTSTNACACTIQMMTQTVSDPVVLARVNNVASGSNTFSLEVLSITARIAWAKVAVNAPNQAPYEVIIFDHLGGDDAINNNPVVCGTQRGDQTIPGPGTWSVVDPRNYNLVTYYHQDHLGSTRVVTDRGGAALNTNSYAPFGTATPGQRFGFAGAESDDETGLLYMKARYESPTLGRMLSADAVIPDLFNPQSLNRYSYVLNNPVNYNDPTGHSHEGINWGSDNLNFEWSAGDVAPADRESPARFYSRPDTISEPTSSRGPIGYVVANPLGWAPYQPFKTEEEAVLNALANTKLRVDLASRPTEYGGAIWRTVSGSFTYGELASGTHYKVDLEEDAMQQYTQGLVPSGSEVVAFVHGHPDARAIYPELNAPELFSDDDREFAERMGVPVFLVTPSGAAKVYVPGNKWGAFFGRKGGYEWTYPMSIGYPSASFSGGRK